MVYEDADAVSIVLVSSCRFFQLTIIGLILCIILHCNSINSDPFETVRMFHGKCTSACPTDLHSHKRSTSSKG